MDTGLLIVLSAIFGILCIGREVIDIRSAKQIRISNLFLIMYGVTYGIVFSLLLIFHNVGIYEIKGTFLRFDYSVEGLNLSTWWLLAAVVGYFSFRVAGKFRIGKEVNKVRAYGCSLKSDASSLERLQITSIICLMIGIVCFYIWVSGWGGYRTLFLNAAAIRNSSYGIRNKVAFFAKPAQIVATVSMIAIYLIKQKKQRVLNVIIFAVSCGISILYYLAKDGRLTMAMYLLIMLFIATDVFEKQRNVSKKVVRVGVLFVLFVLFVLNMNAMTSFLRFGSTEVGEDSSLVGSIMSELAFIYVTGQTALKQYIAEGSPLLIGHDIGSALFAWVPSALTPDGFIDIWHYNTYMIAGGNAPAQYPSDLISTSIYDMGLLGPILLPGFWGAIIGKLDRMFSEKRTPLLIVLYYSLSMPLIRGVNYSMLSATVSILFHLFVTAVVYWGIGHIKVRR